MLKRGRLSVEERAYIADNAGKLSVEQIAEKLERTEGLIEEFIKLHVRPKQSGLNLAPNETEKLEIRQALRTSEKWGRIKEELTPDEIKFFEEEYIKLMSQFSGDVLATEETQIFDVIKFEILKSRNMVERKKAREDINRLERMQTNYLRPFKDDPSRMDDADKEYALQLETQLQSARSAEQSRSTEYVKLQERSDALMKTMKGTRDQRIKQIESSKVTFLGVIRMLQDRDRQEVEGRQMELMKRAGEVEYTRLGRPTTYEDGSMDSPILSAETVNLGPAEEPADE